MRYIRCYEAEGIDSLLTKPRSGRRPKPTGAYKSLLLQAVAQIPGVLGQPFSTQTTANVAQKTGIELLPRQMENILKANDWRLRRSAGGRTVYIIHQHRNTGCRRLLAAIYWTFELAEDQEQVLRLTSKWIRLISD